MGSIQTRYEWPSHNLRRIYANKKTYINLNDGIYLLSEQHCSIQRYTFIARILWYDRQKVGIFIGINANIILMHCIHVELFHSTDASSDSKYREWILLSKVFRATHKIHLYMGTVFCMKNA